MPEIDINKGVKLIINPVSGAGRGEQKGESLHQFLRREGIKTEVFITRRKGDAEQEAGKTYIPIIAVGGDGTINEIINGLGDRKIPLIVWPVGTANLLSREFNFPKNLKRFLSLIKSGEVHLLDAGQVTVPKNQRFLLLASLGLDAEITRLMSQIRSKSIHLCSYLPLIRQALKDYHFLPFTLIIDEQIITSQATMAVIGNIKNYGGYFSITHKARADDGWLDICVFSGRAGHDYLRYIIGLILRRPTIFSDVTYYLGKKIEAYASHPIPVELDGDFIGYTPFTCKVAEKAVALLL